MRGLWTFLALTALTATALAQTTLYQTSFENPPFTAGQPAPPNDDWANGSGTGVSQVVTDELANTGSQSLKWDNSGTNNSFYSIRRVLNWQPTDPDKLVVKVRVYITAGTGADRLYGVYLTGSDTGTLGGTILGVTIAGDGKIRVGTTWGATYSSSAWLAQAPAGTYENRWLQVEMTYDRGSGQATIKVSGFADNAEYTANLTQSTEPRNINLGTDYVTTTARNGIGYFDDLSITAEAGTPFDGWDETANGGGDAGDLPATAQLVTLPDRTPCESPVTRIRGDNGASDVDMYVICITDPANFVASTIGTTRGGIPSSGSSAATARAWCSTMITPTLVEEHSRVLTTAQTASSRAASTCSRLAATTAMRWTLKMASYCGITVPSIQYAAPTDRARRTPSRVGRARPLQAGGMSSRCRARTS
jgi:hypothetical protein